MRRIGNAWSIYVISPLCFHGPREADEPQSSRPTHNSTTLCQKKMSLSSFNILVTDSWTTANKTSAYLYISYHQITNICYSAFLSSVLSCVFYNFKSLSLTNFYISIKEKVRVFWKKETFRIGFHSLRCVFKDKLSILSHSLSQVLTQLIRVKRFIEHSNLRHRACKCVRDYIHRIIRARLLRAKNRKPREIWQRHENGEWEKGRERTQYSSRVGSRQSNAK